ncbi:hypothetical protein AVEN_265456-1 [Araneus ventricosus]|uniref:Uncharacterized protein n=1 Tax=Araneus ventricosus TaxID=182803 RepID=A0A4Y2CGC7_ARAVE|nr:hypothetical protein AVEN_265456-1 [Araneus ventricosus]
MLAPESAPPLQEPRSGFLQRFPCDVTPCEEDYKYTAVRIDWERLSSANAFEESLWSFVCSASWKAGELSVIESAVIVIISELLSVCVARYGSAVTVIASDLLPMLLVYGIYVTKSSFSVILLVALFPPYTHRTIFVTT